MHSSFATSLRVNRVFPVALLSCFLTGVALAAPAQPMFERGTAFALNPEDGKRVPIPLESTEILLDVKPGLMEAQVIQTFTNRTAIALEAIYLYPLPDRATVTHFELRYKDRVVHSEVREKVQAQAVYAAAKAEGKKTALLEQRDPSLFSTAVANFLPGERVQVVVRFVQPLTLTAEAVEVRFPMVTGEKYFPSDTIPGVDGNAAPNPERRDDDTDREIHVYGFDIQIAGIPVKKIESPSHAIRTTQTGSTPEQFAVTLEQQITVPDRDLVLRIETRPEAALQPTVVTQRTATGDYGLVTLFPPRTHPVAQAAPRPRDVLFLLDRSGSMRGPRLESAKLGLNGCLEVLRPQDRFQIVTFDDRHELYLPDWTDATRPALAAAQLHVKGIEARGGTEVQRALAASFDVFERSDRQQILILLTDGDVGNAASLLALVESRIGQVRLFAFGIGAAPNATLIKQIAELGHGQARFISDDASVGRELTDLFATLDAPVLAQPRLTLLNAQGNTIDHTTFPERLSDVFVGRPVQVVYRSTKGTPAAVSLEGMEAERPVTRQFALQASVLRGDGLEKEYGRRFFADTGALLRRAQTEDERTLIRKEMLETALQFQLVTELTSRVLVDDRVSRDPKAELASETVAQFRAVDRVVSGSISVSGSRTTSTPTVVGKDGTVVLSPFEVSSSLDGYYATNSTAGSRQTAVLRVTTEQKLTDHFALPTTEAILPFVIDALSNPMVSRPGTDVGLLDELPIATVVDPSTIDYISLQAAGPALSEIVQHRAPRSPATTLTGRFGSDEFVGLSLKTGFHPGGADNISVLGILSWATFGDPQSSVFLEGEKTFGETKARVGGQWRSLSGYGDMRLVRGAIERKLGAGLVLEAAAAWHQLNRNDAAQFRLGSPAAQVDGLGYLNLDLLTSETRRLADTLTQLKLSGRIETANVQTWSVRGRWHRQESNWLTAPGADPSARRRDTRALDLTHQIKFVDEDLKFTTTLGASGHSIPRTTDERQTTWRGSMRVGYDVSKNLNFFATWSHEEALPWIPTGQWRLTGAEMRAVAPAMETRTGGEAGVLLFDALSRKLSATVAVFHEAVSGHEYRDWSWERTQAALPVRTRVAPDFVREGWTGSLTYIPSRSLTTSVSWSADWKNEGPSHGGNVRGSVVTHYEFRSGLLRNFVSGMALHYRNDFVFDDGFTLQGGWRTDVMLGYRLKSRSKRETVLQLNLMNLADRSWQLTRFAPDRGRQVFFSVAQGF